MAAATSCKRFNHLCSWYKILHKFTSDNFITGSMRYSRPQRICAVHQNFTGQITGPLQSGFLGFERCCQKNKFSMSYSVLINSKIPSGKAFSFELGPGAPLPCFSLFGSVLRHDFSSASDIDFLVEFKTGKVPGVKLTSISATYLKSGVDNPSRIRYLNKPKFGTHSLISA